MVLLLGGIAVEHLDLYSRQIIGYYVARYEYGLGAEIIQFLHGICPAGAVIKLETFDFRGVDVPEYIVAILRYSLLIERLQNVYRISVLAEQGYSHQGLFSISLIN